METANIILIALVGIIALGQILLLIKKIFGIKQGPAVVKKPGEQFSGPHSFRFNIIRKF